jgi:hypothetical protein
MCLALFNPAIYNINLIIYLRRLRVANKKLVYGFGINDVQYQVSKTILVGGIKKKIVFCQYYEKWKGILRRCYSEIFLIKQPTYRGCEVSEDWRHLSKFIKWVDSQPNKNWINCEPDKDLLIDGNKIYSPDTTVFIDKYLNNFLTARQNDRGEHLIGALWKPLNRKFEARCSNPFSDKPDGERYLGLFKTELEAHKAWQQAKHKYACQLADLQEDSRVAEALRQRYAPDKDWTGR